MKININDNPLKVYGSIPEFWNGEMIKYSNETEIYDLGFRDLLIPEIDHTVEKLGSLYYDETQDVGTYEVLAKTEQEIKNEKLQNSEAEKQNLFTKLQETLLADKLLEVIDGNPNTAAQYGDAVQWWEADGETMLKDEICKYWNADGGISLYQASQEITRTEQNNPIAANFAFDIIIFENGYQVYTQRFAHNAFMIGDIVWFPTSNDQLYRSKVDNNAHSPAQAPNSWEIYNP